MRRTPPVATALALCLLFALPSVSHSAFQNGDLYLLSQSLPKPGGGSMRGIVRVEPLSGTSTLLFSAGNTLGVYLEYDSFRDLLVFTRNDSLLGVNSSGALTTLAELPAAQYGAIASRHDGPIYIQLNSEVHYLDSANVLHPLLDEPGTGTFAVGTFVSIRQLHYHEATQSLIACFFGGAVPFCSDASQICVARIPLNASGTQVAGAITATQYEVSTSGESPVGLDNLPGDQVLIVIDTNSNDAEPRMLSLDPASMTVGAFASNGPYTGAAATNAGAYSAARDEVIILDTFIDGLRGYAQGGVGGGVLFSTGMSGFGVSSAGGSGETASLVAIDVVPTPVSGGAPPAGLVLESPYPSPFSPSATVRFHLAGAGDVRLEVYDVRGRRVRTLVDGTRNGGWHDAKWDGTDARGSRVASGVYFLRLASAREIRTQRFVVLR